MGSSLLFNLAAVHGIRLLAVKWLKAQTWSICREGSRQLSVSEIREKDECDILLHSEPPQMPLWSPPDLISFYNSDVLGTL